jgi:mono/diheme cytochrome c family protein
MRKLLFAAAAAALLGACVQQEADDSPAALLAHGEYLVENVVLCGDCHTPMLPEGGWDLSRKLQGAPVAAPPPMANFAPQLAGLPVGYTEEQFVHFVQTGERPDGTHPRPPMPPYRLNEHDARAVATYIKSLPKAAE